MRLSSALAVVLLAASGPTALSGEEQPDSALVARLDGYLARCAAFGWSGVALIGREGKVVFSKGYGFADRESRTPNDVDTLFEIASATKPFTACAVLRLEELGKLSIDDSLSKHLAGVPPDKKGITIRHLLSHTSGMPRSAGGGGPDLDRAVAGYLKTPLARPPGEAFEYWNGGYALLAAIVERATGRSYMDFCREQVFLRAGLQHTGFTGDESLPQPKQAVGYDGEQPVRRAAGHPYGDYGWQYRGMGGVVTSARDLWAFVQAYEAGRVVSPETLRRMESPVTEHYGLGWGMAATKRGTRRVGHGGSVRGFHAEMERFPDERATVIVLSNVDGVPLWTIAWNLEALLFGNPAPYPMPPEIVPIQAEDIDALLGTYVLGEGERVVVERDGMHLRLGAEGVEVARLLAGRAKGDDLDADVALALAIVEAVRRKDAKFIEAQLLESIPTMWAQTLLDRIWPEYLAGLGPLESVRVVGATSVGTRRTQVVVGLRHAKGEGRLKIVLQGGKLNIFDLHGPRFAQTGVYVPTSPTDWATFSWMGPQPPGVRFETDRLGKRGLRVAPGSSNERYLSREPVSDAAAPGR